TEIGSLARLDRLERRIGVGAAPQAAAGSAAPASAPAASTTSVSEAPVVEVPRQTKPAIKPIDFPSASSKPASTPTTPIATIPETAAAAPAVSAPAPTPAPAPAIGAVTAVELREAWPDVLSVVNKISKTAWMVAFALTVVDYSDDVLTLRFANQRDLDTFKTPQGGADAVRKAIFDLLGVQVKFKAQVAEPTNTASMPVVASAPAAAPAAKAAPAMTWAPEPEAPSDEPEPPFDEPEAQAAPAVASAPAAAKAAPAAKFTRNEDERYGESLLREMLGAKPIADKNGK
ncbi:MAG: hypothetical protein RL672_593, partial [Actinomycetota bacterium]